MSGNLKNLNKDSPKATILDKTIEKLTQFHLHIYTPHSGKNLHSPPPPPSVLKCCWESSSVLQYISDHDKSMLSFGGGGFKEENIWISLWSTKNCLFVSTGFVWNWTCSVNMNPRVQRHYLKIESICIAYCSKTANVGFLFWPMHLWMPCILIYFETQRVGLARECNPWASA